MTDEQILRALESASRQLMSVSLQINELRQALEQRRASIDVLERIPVIPFVGGEPEGCPARDFEEE